MSLRLNILIKRKRPLKGALVGKYNSILFAHIIFFCSLTLSGCNSENGFLSWFGLGGDKTEEEVREFVESSPPSKRTVVRESIRRGDLATAVNTIVDPPTGNADCEVRAPASTTSLEIPESGYTMGSCPKEEFKNSNVLYIGDSHSVIPSESSSSKPRLGHVVTSGIKSCEGAKISYHAVCGARPKSFTSSGKTQTTCGLTENYNGSFQYRYSTYTDDRGRSRPNKHYGDNLETILEKDTPAHVIINLGDNMFNWTRQADKRVKASIKNSESKVNEINDMLEKIPTGAKCTWVGPTYHKSGSTYIKPNRVVDEFYLILKTAIGDRCKLIDSRRLVVPSSPNDGLHLVRSESLEWGKKVMENL